MKSLQMKREIRVTSLILVSVLLLSYGDRSPDSLEIWKSKEWVIQNDSYEGNPFDMNAVVVFLHPESGEQRKTGMFYDGKGEWKFRFTATRTGTWNYVSLSPDEDLDGISGQLEVVPNTDSNAHGFMKNFGSKWGWQGTEKAFIPQYVGGKRLSWFYNLKGNEVDTGKMEQDITEFIHEHGFTGFHFSVARRWFNLEGDEHEGNPDLRTYRVLETMIRKVHENGGSCHLWMWGKDEVDRPGGSGPKTIIGGAMNETDKRNLSYLAARLGPLPGWSLGYGFDTENEVVSKEIFNAWKAFLENRMGWNHFIGARVGYDEFGPYGTGGPKPELDEKFNAPVGDAYCSWLGGDYIGYTSYRPMYDRYVEVINHQPQKPSFEEDRFRIRNRERWSHKDYNDTLTRRGLWNSAMAGGVANIWSSRIPDRNEGGSQPYIHGRANMKHQIKTYARFFESRFIKELERAPALTAQNARSLKNPENDLFIFYREDAPAIYLDLKYMNGEQQAVAVDTKKAYKEINLGILKPREQVWTAPYESDWAIAIGDFD